MSFINTVKAFGTDYVGKILTNEQEVARQIAKNGLNNLTKNPQNAFAGVYKAMQNEAGEEVNKDILQALRKTKKTKDGGFFAEGVDDGLIKSISDNVATKRKVFEDAMNSDSISESQINNMKEALGGNIGYYSRAGKNYFTQDGKKLARVGTAAGVGVGTRYLSGGTITQNNRGEKDIAGIPFF